MRRIGRSLVSVLLAVSVSMAAWQPAGATETINSVSIKVVSRLEAGDRLDEIQIDDPDAGTVSVSSSAATYEITGAKWVSSASKGVGIGDQPKMLVTLTPTDERSDYFKSSYKTSSLKISGGEAISARKSGADLLVSLRLKPIKGTYDAPDNAYWKETNLGHAVWEAESNTSGAYDVWLYRGKTSVYKADGVRATTYNFYPYMTEEGVYTFRVRSVPYKESELKNGKKSGWEESGELVITARDVSDGTGQKGKKESGSTASSAASENTNTYTKAGWYKRDGHWYYRGKDGADARGGWLELDDKWYMFQPDGKMATGWNLTDGKWYYLSEDGMLTGWAKINGKWYYLNPGWDVPQGSALTGWNVIDGHTYCFGSDAAMLTGWINDHGSWYYLDELENGIQGAMLKGWIKRNGETFYTNEYGVMQDGWQEIDGYWYYFYPGHGNMAVDTLINGMYLDVDGIWREAEG